MEKIYTALGLMSGTSLDGIDASIIRSDGEKFINIEKNEYYSYNDKFQDQLRKFIKACNNKEYIEKNDKIYSDLQNELTIKHAEISNKIIKNYGEKIDFIGFHGHTIIHKPDKSYSIQMGDGQLLSQILKQKVIYNFRKKDIENKGEGAPLASIYHYNLSKKLNLREPVIFLNIGGISNITYINKNEIQSQDIGPGNVLMDEYIKKIKNQKFDKEGYYASIGKVDKKIINQSIENEFFKKKHSFDKKDFNYSFVKSLNFEDAMATLTYFTAKITSNFLNNNHQISKVILCGGGRKNKTLINHIKDLTSKDINDINDFGIDGDYVESQAFGYLAIRSFLKKKISFPQTTKVKQSITGGELVKNY